MLAPGSIGRGLEINGFGAVDMAHLVPHSLKESTNVARQGDGEPPRQ
jgi:hypothetical protein